MTLAAGQVLQNRYRIVAQLGQGGMGAVYRAWDTRLNVSLALKEMIPQPTLDQQTLAALRKQFQQEAQILARLSHPHLVRVTDFFEESGNAYLVMDFVEGESLADRIEREGALAEQQVLDWTQQLLDALAYCHAQGIIHRDIKPQNVIIRSDGRAILVDFGLVKLWDPNDPHTRTVMRGMGTPEYAPPEQYDTQIGHTDARSDIYGLGATIYHALTGQAPPTATMRIASPAKYQPPRMLNPRLSPATETSVLRATELAVENRFGSAEEMAAALRGGVHTPTVRVAPASTKTKVIPGARAVTEAQPAPVAGRKHPHPPRPRPGQRRQTRLQASRPTHRYRRAPPDPQVLPRARPRAHRRTRQPTHRHQ
jgi:serine/threonine protein kinase